MSNPNLPTFVPHTDEADLGFSGSWRPMLAHHITERGIKLQILGKQTKDDEISGVIMPSFDWSINPADPAFQLGVSAHMSTQADPKKTVHFLPSAWATPWKCYTFQGPANEHFISPSNRAKMIGGSPDMDKDLLADAFDDIYLFIKRHPKMDAQAKDFYLKKPDMNTDARVPLVERKYFSNMVIRDKKNKTDTHVIECFTSAAYHYLIEQMRWATPYGGNPIDPTWPKYLLGDPTNPSGALVWHQEKMKVGGLQMDSNVMCLTAEPEQLSPSPERRPITSAHLAGRINLYDPSVWNWPTYQEMADFALEHWTEVPRDLIADACSHRATVGLRSKKAEVFDGGGAPRQGAVGAEPPQQSSVAYKDPTPPPAAAPAPAASPASAPAQEESRWVIGPATGGQVVKWTLEAIREFAASGKLTSEQVNTDGTAAGWKSFAAAGFPAPAPIAPPPVVETPSAPAAPAAPAAPLPPAAPAAPATNASSDLQAKIDELVPTYHSMTPDKQERVRATVGAIVSHTAGNAGAPVPAHLAQELGQILMG